MSILLGIDIGGTTVKMGLVEFIGKPRILKRDHELDTPKGPPEEFADLVAARARHLIGKARVDGLGICCPGLVDNRRGIIRDITNLPNLRGYALCRAMSERLLLPAAIQNDANAAALGQVMLIGGIHSLVLLTLGTGVGGGVVCNGQLLTGADNYAAELGHVKVSFDHGAACGCGRRGCLEAYAGQAGITRIAMDEILVSGGQTTLHLNAKELTTLDITRAAEAGDKVARHVLRRVGSYLGRGMATFIDIFNPEQIVIGGGASVALKWMRPGINQSLFEYSTFDITRKRCVVRRSDHADKIGVIGAAATFLKASGSDA